MLSTSLTQLSPRSIKWIQRSYYLSIFVPDASLQLYIHIHNVCDVFRSHDIRETYFSVDVAWFWDRREEWNFNSYCDCPESSVMSLSTNVGYFRVVTTNASLQFARSNLWFNISPPRIRDLPNLHLAVILLFMLFRVRRQPCQVTPQEIMTIFTHLTLPTIWQWLVPRQRLFPWMWTLIQSGCHHQMENIPALMIPWTSVMMISVCNNTG